jgi:hypothetical protein
LVGVAVKITGVPSLTGFSDATIDTLTGKSGFTVTVTLCVLLQPVAVMVSTTVYVVVTVGETVGLAAVEEYPAGEDVQL